MNILEGLKKISLVFEENKKEEIKNFDKSKDRIIKNYLNIIQDTSLKTTAPQLMKIKEESISRLGEIYSKLKLTNKLIELNKIIRPLFSKFPKVTTAKIVKNIIGYINRIPNTRNEQIQLCKESIEWCVSSKRTFLKQRIESKLANLYYVSNDFENAIKVLTKLIREVRRLDDKSLLVEIFLLESKVQFSLKNVPKAKASLIASRHAGESIYIPPLLQGDLDTQSGIIYAAERDYKTSYSFFFEAFESYHNLGHERTVFCLKYMLMCKIMSGQTEDLMNILSNKNTLDYANTKQIESLKAIATAYEHKSIHEFEDALKKFEKELIKDRFIQVRIDELYEELLEMHLLRIIKPFSRVQISHVAKLIKLEKKKVERKLSLMVLDKKFNGILDQGNDCLITFDDSQEDELLSTAGDGFDKISIVIDSLFDKAKKLEN